MKDNSNKVQANPSKINVLLSGIIVVLILILTLQIWMMYGALNNALDENQEFACATFIGSTFLFLAGLFILKYLPVSNKKEVNNTNNLYD